MIFKKPVLSDGITESTFECKRDGLTIRGTIYRQRRSSSECNHMSRIYGMARQ